MAISLEKIQEKAPSLISLVKAADEVSRELGLKDHTAAVDLVLDVSGSMAQMYQSGKVQRLASKILALATRFDDDGKIGVYTFNNRSRAEGEMSLENFGTYISRIQVGGGTSYAPVMREVLGAGESPAAAAGAFFAKMFGKDKAPASGKTPSRLILFVTDGDNDDHAAAEAVIREASALPVFWQFMAIGPNRETFPFLCHLDDMEGRYLDNADFFTVSDPESLGDTALFEKFLGEYPTWLRQAEAKALIHA